MTLISTGNKWVELKTLSERSLNGYNYDMFVWYDWFEFLLMKQSLYGGSTRYFGFDNYNVIYELIAMVHQINQTFIVDNFLNLNEISRS